MNTLRTVLQSLQTEALEAAFRPHAKTLPAPGAADVDTDGEADAAAASWPVIALDGKTLRRSLEHLKDGKPTQTLTAFTCQSAFVLAHREIDEKSNGIPVAEEMIRVFGLTSVVDTADTMHCQKNL